MEQDFQESLRFLRLIYPTGPWMLTAISVDKKSIEARTFSEQEAEHDIIAWLNLHKAKNLYYSVNQPTDDAREKRKLSKTDVHSVHFLHVDVDPRAGEDVESEQARILTQLTSYKIEPSFIIFSGGGYNALWKLDTPVDISNNASSQEDAVQRAMDVERRNWQFELDFSTPDHCRDVSRILRLPGTLNRPNTEKIAKGRTIALSRVQSEPNHSYPLSLFMATPHVSSNTTNTEKITQNIQRTESLDNLKISEELKVVIAQGFNPEDKKYDGDRSSVLYYVCCELIRQNQPDDVILGIITDSRFLISASVLDKGQGMMRYALRQVQRAKDNAVDKMLVEFNDKFAVIINYGGKCVVMSEEPGGELEFRKKREFFDGMDHVKRTHVNARGKEISIGVGTWWFNHPMRRQYGHAVFEPGIETTGDVNLWRGFSVAPTPGTRHLRYLEHMFENICSGDQEHYDYLLKWMARVVQTPRTQSMVAPVLLGDRGTGKSIFAGFFSQIFSPHDLVVSNIDHLTGNFNAHLSERIFVTAEEAFDLRNKRHESALKELITGPMRSVERKGYDVIRRPNYVHLMMTSNNSRVVPAGDKERRFFVIRVGEKKIQNSSYFSVIMEDRRSTGVSNLLHHLMSVDLSEFDVTKVPATEALRGQQEHNLFIETEWLLGKLEAGVWLQNHKWEGPVIKHELYSDYIRTCELLHVKHPMSHRAFVVWLKSELPETKSKQIAEAPRPFVFIFQPLEDCRTRYLKNRGWTSYNWAKHEVLEQNPMKDNVVRGVFD